MILVKSSTKAELVIHREDLASLMQQQEVSLKSKDVKSINEKLERAKPMRSLISVGSHHIGNDCVLESRRLGVLIIIWKNPLPFCLVHMMLFHVACDRESLIL